jgi:GcrA cell cycle regulator
MVPGYACTQATCAPAAKLSRKVAAFLRDQAVSRAAFLLQWSFLMADWSDRDIETVKAMWRSGATAADIAAALGGGATRGAVLGKIHRLGLKRGEEPQAKTSARGSKAKAPEARPQRAAKPVGRPAANAQAADPGREPKPIGPMPIWALGQCQCRWPIGNLLDPPGLFCAAVTVDGSSWCPAHEAMVYTGTSRPRPEAMPVREPRLAAMGARSRF